MRILLLSPDAPVPTHVNGGVTRQYQLYRRLIELGHEVTVVGVLPVGIGDPTELMCEEGFDFRTHRRPRSRVTEVATAILRRPATLHGLMADSAEDFATRIFWVSLEPLVYQALSDGPYDVICVEFGFASHWLSELSTDVATVLTSHEVKSVQFREKSERLHGLRRLLMRENARRQLASERRWSTLPDAVIAMSEEEIERWREAVPSLPPAYAVGNGADIAALDAVGPDDGKPVVLFTGTMAYTPNAVAADWMARVVWPLIREQRPDARLEIVGRSPGEATLALAGIDGVSVHPDPPSMVPHFQRSAVCVLPMLEGGGTRLKFAEAMAAGRPVVSTSNGASGIEIEDGREALIADDPEQFAVAVLTLLGNPSRRRTMGDNARQRAREAYDWRTLGDRYAAVLAEVVAAKRRQSQMQA